MGRRVRGPLRPSTPEHRINHRIRIREIRVIDPDGQPLGVMSPEDGRGVAREHGLDLVEVAPNERPPVCKIMDYGKFKYERAKKQAGKQNASSLKTVQVRPKTGDHDLKTKMARARQFLERGDRVKLVMRMRGRERAFPERWAKILREHYDGRLAEIGKVVSHPTAEGRIISMLVEPRS